MSQPVAILLGTALSHTVHALLATHALRVIAALIYSDGTPPSSETAARRQVMATARLHPDMQWGQR